MDDDRRFHRNELLFGKEGQEKIAKARVVVVGLGGTGSHMAQQLAYLGVRDFALLDRDKVTPSSLNRLIGALPDDADKCTPKVEVAKRVISKIRSDTEINPIRDTAISEAGFDAIKNADYVFGCVDRDGVRLILTELCAAYQRPYFDIATDIEVEENLMFGGRYVLSRGNLCPVCTGEVDRNEIQRDLSTPERREEEDRLYGIQRDALEDEGPSVVSLNGILASLCVTEFMVWVTGLRQPKEHLKYYGMGFRDGRVSSRDQPDYPDCFYCKGVHGKREAADVERYVRAGIGTFL